MVSETLFKVHQHSMDESKLKIELQVQLFKGGEASSRFRWFTTTKIKI